MTDALIIAPSDAERPGVETFIRQVYAAEFGARVEAFAPLLIARYNSAGKIMCAAGLRLAEGGFFSEAYLDEPVEAALSRRTGRRVPRADIFEVTTLASRSPRELSPFIDDITAFGARAGLSWSFFTLTRRLSLLVARRHLALVHLADAAAERMEDHSAWGRYYETDPKVYAVSGALLRRPVRGMPAAPVVEHAGLY